MTATAEKIETLPVKIAAFRGNLPSGEYGRSTFVMNLLLDITLEQALSPEHWRAHASMVQDLDLVQIASADRSWYAEALCRGKRPDGSPVWGVIKYVDFDESVETTQDVEKTGHMSYVVKGSYDVTWNRNDKWRVVRKSDGHICASQIIERKDAIRDAMDHWKASMR